MICPICKKSGVTAGHILGHAGAGVPKRFTKAERERRRVRLAESRKNRWNKS